MTEHNKKLESKITGYIDEVEIGNMHKTACVGLIMNEFKAQDKQTENKVNKWKKYYLISYAHPNGFGNIFYKVAEHLNIREVEKKLGKGIVIITINDITKEQYISNPKTNDGC